MCLSTNISRRGAVYYIRVRIPSDLVDFYSPKKEITYSLHTKDSEEAKRRANIERVKIDQQFTEARREKKLRAQEEALAAASAAGAAETDGVVPNVSTAAMRTIAKALPYISFLQRVAPPLCSFAHYLRPACRTVRTEVKSADHRASRNTRGFVFMCFPVSRRFPANSSGWDMPALIRPPAAGTSQIWCMHVCRRGG